MHRGGIEAQREDVDGAKLFNEESEDEYAEDMFDDY